MQIKSIYSFSGSFFGISLGLVLALQASEAYARLLPDEIKGIQDTLYIGNLNLKDLEYSRRPYDDAYRLPIVNLALEHPLQAADRLMDLHEAGGKASVSELLKIARREILDDSSAEFSFNESNISDSSRIQIPAEVPESVRAPVRMIAWAVAQANAAVEASLMRLSREERETLIQSLPQWATEEPSIKFDFVHSPQAKQEEILRLLAKVDLSRIMRAAQALSQAIETELPALRRGASGLEWRGKSRFAFGGIHVLVSGVGDDVHSNENAELLIDLGGNDHYKGRIASGIARAAVLIDVSGDDVYDVSDASVGAGILGIGLAYDLGGNDHFKAKSISLGAGLAGVGVLYKDGGDDIYQSAALTQGFGEFGIGALIDTSGNDFYDAKLFAQGAARTRGVGWLVDREGNDTYRAGGLILNSPLFKDVHYSNAQGYASGYREDAYGGLSGGVGLITDMSGDDAYIAETYAQAASYWFSLGSLYDASGNDSYSAFHYSQSSAMHMTAAYLFDLAGDDKYTVSWGASFGIGHDFGVAMFLDRAGNDVYAAGAAGPGTGVANGVGIFFDGQGDDRFTGAPASGNAARGSGSLAVFTHLNGHGKYPEGLAEGHAGATPSWGMALDTVAPPSEPLPSFPKPGSIPMKTDAELEVIYKNATDWDVGTARKRVAHNKGLLVGMGVPALQWMLAHHLAGADATEMYVFVEVTRPLGTEGRKEIAQSLLNPDDKAAKVAARIAYELKAKEAAHGIAIALHRPFVQRTAAMAAGAVGSTESIQELIRIAHGEDKITARCALVSLGQLSAQDAQETAKEFLYSDELPLRKAAIELLAKVSQGRTVARGLLSSPDEHTARIGLEIFAAIGDPDAIQTIGEALGDPRPGVKIQALTSLGAEAQKKFRKSIEACAQDPNPLVQAVARKVLANNP